MTEFGKAYAAITGIQKSLEGISNPAFNTRSFIAENRFLPQIPEMREGWQQLIVIGNGFDLECGLKSKYSDFFDSRKKAVYPDPRQLDCSKKSWGEHLNENGITVWDIILEEYADALWNDIEKQLQNGSCQQIVAKATPSAC